MICKLGQIFQLFPTPWLPRTFGKLKVTVQRNSWGQRPFKEVMSPMFILDLLHFDIRVPVSAVLYLRLSGDGWVSPWSWLAWSLVAGVVTHAPRPHPVLPLYHHHRQYLHWSPILSEEISPVSPLHSSLLPAQGHWSLCHIVLMIKTVLAAVSM